MSLWSEVRERTRALFFGASEDREMEEELQFHLEQEAAKYERAGVAPAEARRRAAIAFGGTARIREEVREARGAMWVQELVRDARIGWRSLLRTPGFTVVAVAPPRSAPTRHPPARGA